MSSSAPKPLAGYASISRAYDLGTIESCRYLPLGVLNRNWRIETERGVFALKELGNATPEDARRSLALVHELAAAGVPVVEAVPAASGAVVPEIGGHAYYLTPWIDGTHPRGADMGADHAFHMGAVIGRIHRALADPATGLAAPEPPDKQPTTSEDAREGIGHHLERIDRREHPSAFDTDVAAVLRDRLDLLAAHGHLRPADTPPLAPFGWIHGDCQNWNLLWVDDRIAAVLDWDRVRVNAYGEEIVRAAMYQFVHPDGSVDLGNLAALVAGYRTEAAIGADALVDAARRRWWRLASSVWQLEFIYDRGDRSSEALFFSGERLLHWWTANLTEVEKALATA